MGCVTIIDSERVVIMSKFVINLLHSLSHICLSERHESISSMFWRVKYFHVLFYFIFSKESTSFRNFVKELGIFLHFSKQANPSLICQVVRPLSDLKKNPKKQNKTKTDKSFFNFYSKEVHSLVGLTKRRSLSLNFQRKHALCQVFKAFMPIYHFFKEADIYPIVQGLGMAEIPTLFFFFKKEHFFHLPKKWVPP